MARSRSSSSTRRTRRTRPSPASTITPRLLALYPSSCATCSPAPSPRDARPGERARARERVARRDGRSARHHLLLPALRARKFLRRRGAEGARRAGGPLLVVRDGLRLPPRIRIGRAVVMLNHDTRLYPHHVDEKSMYDFSAPVAEVAAHPTRPGVWGLKNLSARSGSFTGGRRGQRRRAGAQRLARGRHAHPLRQDRRRDQIVNGGGWPSSRTKGYYRRMNRTTFLPGRRGPRLALTSVALLFVIVVGCAVDTGTDASSSSNSSSARTAARLMRPARVRRGRRWAC